MARTDMALTMALVAALFGVAALASSGSTRTFAAFAALMWIFAVIAQLP
jgi:hypothetical protein